MRNLEEANRVIIKQNDIRRSEEMKQKFNKIMKSLNEKIDIIEQISLNNTKKCLGSYKKLIKIESDVLQNRNYTIDKLKIEDSINTEYELHPPTFKMKQAA